MATAVPMMVQQPMAAPQMMAVTCPAGVVPGQMLQITSPSGAPMQVAVPAGVGPGMVFQVAAPAMAPVAAMAAPAMVAAPAGVQYVQTQQMVVTGYQGLSQMPSLFVKQRVEMLEAFTGFEGANIYDIMSNGQQVFTALEESGCCERQFCKNMRPFKMSIVPMNAGGNPTPLLTFERPYRCTPQAGYCCYLQEVWIYEGAGNSENGGRMIGQLKQNFTCMASSIDVIVGGKKVNNIAGPCCVCDGPCCGDQVFKVLSDGGNEIMTGAEQFAEIRKMSGDFVTQAFTQADDFGITFPPTASADARAVLLAAVFLIDMLFFEKSNNSD